MDKLYPIVRRVRRPLLPAEEVVSREGAKVAKGTEVPVSEVGSREDARPPETEVSGETPEVLADGHHMLPENVE